MSKRKFSGFFGIILAALCGCTSALAQDGSWDSRWQPGGTERLGIPGLFVDLWTLGGSGDYEDDMTATATAVQSDGKVLVAGFGWNTYQGRDQNACILRRYNVDGSVDTSFGNGGAAITNLHASGANPKVDCYSKAIAIQPDGMIVTAEQAVFATGQTPTISIERHTPQGTWDGSFGNGGYVNNFGIDANAVAIARNGDILVGGIGIPQNSSDTDLYLYTLSAGGQLKDQTWLGFGAAGSDGNQYASAMVLESWSTAVIGGPITNHDYVYVVGTSDNAPWASGLSHHSCAVAAFSRTNGGNFSIDTGFGNGGLVIVDFPVGLADTDTICRSATKAPLRGFPVPGPTGVVVGGERYYTPSGAALGSASYYALAEISANGTVTRHDNFAFFADLNEAGAFNSIFGLTWDNRGKLVAVGYAGIGASGDGGHAPSDAVLRRFNADLSTDVSFYPPGSGTLFASLDLAGVSGLTYSQREWANAVTFDPLLGRVVFVGERSLWLALFPNRYNWFLGAVHDGTSTDVIFANGFE